MADDIERIRDDLKDMKGRIERIEDWRSEQTIQSALLDAHYKTITNRLDKIDSHVARLLWIIIGGFVAAIITFVVKGGLNFAL